MKLSTKDMVLVSLFAALIAIGTFIRIPMQPVAFTLQTVFVMYSGLILGGRRAFASVSVYVLAGLIGAPIFANGAGGIGYILSPSFGYLLGFMIAAYAIGKLSEKIKKLTIVKTALILFLGTILIYLLGLPYLYIIMTRVIGKDIGLAGILAAGLSPFILPDFIKLFVVATTASKVMPLLRRSGILE